jgi:hypothetical protein
MFSKFRSLIVLLLVCTIHFVIATIDIGNIQTQLSSIPLLGELVSKVSGAHGGSEGYDGGGYAGSHSSLGQIGGGGHGGGGNGLFGGSGMGDSAGISAHWWFGFYPVAYLIATVVCIGILIWIKVRSVIFYKMHYGSGSGKNSTSSHSHNAWNHTHHLFKPKDLSSLAFNVLDGKVM